MAETKRASWTNSIEFVLTCISYAVGLTNIWRFPYLCYKNGGGAFLIPYLLMLLLCGVPVTFLEFLVGQYVGLGALPIWKICPIFQGLGITAFILNLYVTWLYFYIIVMACYYLVASFSRELPWQTCDNPWNTPNCVDIISQSHGITVSNTSVIPGGVYNNSTLSTANTSSIVKMPASDPAQEYLLYGVLQISEGITSIGGIRAPMLAILLILWILIFCVTIKGVQSSGKAMYFTSTFPYLILTIFVIRGLTLDGSLQGISFYMLPKWHKLLEPQVWFSAAQQVVISLGLGYGCFITMASYNGFHNNCLRDAIVSSLINCGTSIYAGFAVFSALGFIAHKLNVNVDDVVQSGPGLVFVAYPTAMSYLVMPQLWSVMFFLMILTLGLGTVTVHFETVISCMVDQFPIFRSTWKRIVLAGTIGLFIFSISIILYTQAGIYWFTLLDWYSSAIPLMIACSLECFIFGWILGDKWLKQIAIEMLGMKLNLYFSICWRFAAPALMVAILLVNVITWQLVTYDEYQYPIAAHVLGWIVCAIPLIPIPVMIAVNVLKTTEGTWSQRIKQLLQPSERFKETMKQRASKHINKHEDPEHKNEEDVSFI